MIKARDIEEVEIDKLVHYAKNANKHPQDQIDDLIKNIQYQGFRVPLIVDRETMEVVAGNGRLEAAKALGMTHVPVSFQDFESEDQKYAFMVADNALQQRSMLDFSMIHLELPNMEFPLEMLGIKDWKFEPDIEAINRGDENSEWAQGMPEFKEGEDYIKLTYIFGSEAQRKEFVEKHNIEIKTKLKTTWIVYP